LQATLRGVPASADASAKRARLQSALRAHQRAKQLELQSLQTDEQGRQVPAKKLQELSLKSLVQWNQALREQTKLMRRTHRLAQAELRQLQQQQYLSNQAKPEKPVNPKEAKKAALLSVLREHLAEMPSDGEPSLHSEQKQDSDHDTRMSGSDEEEDITRAIQLLRMRANLKREPNNNPNKNPNSNSR
jgi:hypothetical protein